MSLVNDLDLDFMVNQCIKTFSRGELTFADRNLFPEILDHLKNEGYFKGKNLFHE